MGKLCNDMQRFTSPLFYNPLILLDSLAPPLGTKYGQITSHDQLLSFRAFKIGIEPH